MKKTFIIWLIGLNAFLLFPTEPGISLVEMTLGPVWHNITINDTSSWSVKICTVEKTRNDIFREIVNGNRGERKYRYEGNMIIPLGYSFKLVCSALKKPSCFTSKEFFIKPRETFSIIINTDSYTVSVKRDDIDQQLDSGVVENSVLENEEDDQPEPYSEI